MIDLDRVTPDSALRLADLIRELGPHAAIVGDALVEVTGVHHDSRRVMPGDLFVARKGSRTDGAAYVREARARGATALLAERGTLDGTEALPVIIVDDAMDGLARAAAAVYGHPSFGLEVVGVTGTNGKTTTTHLLRAAIDAAVGREACGVIGTVTHGFGPLQAPAAHTTPEADDIQRLLLAMKRQGATHVAMEVSSIALAVGRTRTVRFTVAALTNLTQDHLDFHGTMDAYGAAKAKLFLEYGPGTSVICVDHPFGRATLSRVAGPKVSVSAHVDGDAEVKPTHIALSARGVEGELHTPVGTFALHSPLVGAHNVENIVVALGCVHALGLDLRRAVEAMSSTQGAPGRLERVGNSSDELTVLVDYAHTPDALERVLDAVRAALGEKGRVVCVFGCGGDRDKQKRGPMGEAVATRADVAVITSDNPRTERPEDIAESIVTAARKVMEPIALADIAHRKGYVVELDRARAIDLAITNAARGDLVLIAGKGHEDYQVIGTEKRSFDDREYARAALAARRARAV